MTFTYRMGRALCRFVGFCCIKLVVLHRERGDATGGVIVACTHLSHVEPFVLTALLKRPIDWMARIEFYKYRVVAGVLRRTNAFPVDRYGVPVSSIRTAIARAQEGRMVGIFPDGGVARGNDSIMRGGAFKKGVCVVSYRARVPVLPVVVLGTEELTRVKPWLPFKHGSIQVIFGNLVHPPLHEPRRRVAREMMARDLQAEFQRLYAELCQHCHFDEGAIG